MDNNWLNHPSLQGMEPEKKKIIQDFIKETKGKPMEVGMQAMMKANEKLKAQNLSLTENESELISNI